MPMETITDEMKLEHAGFRWREKNGVRALSCAPLERDGFANAFSTRLGGVSPMRHDALNLAGFDDDAAENIHENRRRFLRVFDEQWTLAVCWQVHGVDVRVVRDMNDARADEERCDGLISNTPGVLLGVKSADCVPVILGDRRTGACASVHAGWRGTVAGIVPRAIERMRAEFGSDPSDVRAAIGPAALACCYEVGAEVTDAFHRSFNYADELFTPTRDGHARIDLHEANRRQLIEAAVEAAKIHTLPLCTMCRTDLFFSYRREKSVYGRTGRLLSVIGRMGAARE